VRVPNPETGDVGEAKLGNTARVVWWRNGTQQTLATLPSLLFGQEGTGGSRLALLNGNVYVTSAIWNADLAKGAPQRTERWAAVLKVSGGQATEVANTWDIESKDNPDPNILDTHPYGLAAGRDGMLYVADAGANALFKVNPSSGEVSVVAVFPGLPFSDPNPARGGKNEVDPVPTGIIANSDGSFYVSFLPGGPPIPGGSKVVKVTADGKISDFATGLTYTTDIRMGPDGNIYAVQIFTRAGEQGPDPTSGAVMRITPDGKVAPAIEGLAFPSSVDFDRAGNAYVTINTLGAPGSGQVVRFDGIAAK
jgi:hypothetical protein